MTKLTKSQERMLQELRDAGGEREFDGRRHLVVQQLEDLGLVTSESSYLYRGVMVRLVK